MIKKAVLTTGIIFLTYSPVNGETIRYQSEANNLLNKQTYLTSPVQDYNTSPISQDSENRKEGGLEFLIPRDFIASSGDRELNEKIRKFRNLKSYY